MARGKHKNIARRKSAAQLRARQADATVRLDSEKLARAEAETQAAYALDLVREIEELRQSLSARCSDEESTLRNEISDLLAALDTLQNEDISTSPQEKRIASSLMFNGFPEGVDVGPEVMEAVLIEAERRMMELWPEVAKPPAENLTITRGVDKPHKIGLDGVRAIQRARGIRR